MKTLILSLLMSLSVPAVAIEATWQPHGEGALGTPNFIEQVRTVSFCGFVRGGQCFDEVDAGTLGETQKVELVTDALKQVYFYDDVDVVESKTLQEVLTEAYPEGEVAAFTNRISENAVVVQIHIIVEDDLNLKEWWDIFEIYDPANNTIYRTQPFNYGKN